MNNNQKNIYPGLKITTGLLLVAAIVALYFFKHTVVQESVILVPIEFSELPRDLIIAATSVDNIETRVKGPENILENLAAPVCRLDISGAQAGEKFIPVTPDFINLPSGIEIIETIPTAVIITIEKNTVKEVPVEITHTGAPAKGYRVAGMLTLPESVLISGPKSVLAGITSVKTKPIDISGVTDSFKKESVPVLDKRLMIIDPKGPVIAEISITEKIVTKKLSLSVTSQSKNVEIAPPTADIEISGPENQFSNAGIPSGIKITIDVKSLTPGVYVRRAAITLPVDFTLISVQPEIFTLTIN